MVAFSTCFKSYIWAMSIFERATRWSSRHRLASHLIFWLVVAVITITDFDSAYDEQNNLLNRFIKTCFFVLFYMMGSYFVAYFILPRLMASKKHVLTVLYFLMGSYVICALLRILTVHVLEPLIRIPPFEKESIAEIITDVPWLFGHYFIHFFSIAWIFGFFKLLKDQYLVQQRKLLLEKEKTESELNILKAQLNPHFLFNTLNNIYSLSLVNSPVISKSITELSEILDHILNRCNETYVPVSTEITLLHNYIELEKLRYSDRLRVDFQHNIDRDAPIAPLILLSLAENAFKHGAGEDIGNPSINMVLNLESNQFKFLVANTFVESPATAKAERIGLSNIKKQLDLIYGPNYDFHISTSDGMFAVLLLIDLEAHEKSISPAKSYI